MKRRTCADPARVPAQVDLFDALLMPASHLAEAGAADGAFAWLHVGANPEATSFLACPRPGLLSSPGCATQVLLRAPDGRLWRFALRRRFRSARTLHAWLDDFAACASRCPEDTHPGLLLPAPMRAEAVFADDATLDAERCSSWPIGTLATACAGAAEARQAMHAVDGRRALELQREAVHAELARGLHALAGLLDAQAAAVASRGGALRIDLYNFLVLAPTRRNRLQFAHSFAPLLEAAAGAGGDAQRLALRELVDRGAPLVKALAERWAVSPSALRALRLCPPDTMVSTLTPEPWALAKLLDAIVPERRPRQVEHWHALARAVRVANILFGQRPSQSEPALQWVVRCARGGWIEQDRFAGLAAHRPLPDGGFGGLFRIAYEEWAASQGGAPGRSQWNEPRLLAMRRCFEWALHLARQCELLDLLPPVLRRLPALLPQALRSSDGTREMVALTSIDELRDHGSRLGNCLREERLGLYATLCTIGESFMVSLRSPATGRVVSLAELRPVSQGGMLRFGVAQHRAGRNGDPEANCVAALGELMARLNGGEFDSHLLATFDPGAPPGLLVRALRQAAEQGVFRERVAAAAVSRTNAPTGTRRTS